MGVTFYCSSVGGGNRVHDILASPFGPNCDSAVSFTNIHVEAPSFANPVTRDYRIPNTGSQANNLARYLLGPYADRVPGPQL
jgi:hypothetical protein